jgi:hypothetical protein
MIKWDNHRTKWLMFNCLACDCWRVWGCKVNHDVLIDHVLLSGVIKTVVMIKTAVAFPHPKKFN